MGLVCVYALRQLWDIDIFWHVAAGRLIAEQGLGVSRDTFSAIDPDRPWIPLVWGYHLFTHFVDRAWGLQGLRLVHAALQILGFGLFYWTCRRRLKLGALVSLALFALLVVMYADRFRARPHVFNLNFEILLLPWLAAGPRSFDRRALAVTALVFGLWANIHGGGAFVLLVAAATVPVAASIDRLLRVPGREGHLSRAWLWFGCAAGPAVLSPLFVRSVVHTFAMVDATYEYTFEWHPSFRLFMVGTLPAHFIAAAVPTLVALGLVFPVARIVGTWRRDGLAGLRKALGEYELHRVLLGIALGYLAHRSIRFVYMSVFALLIQAPLVARALSGVKIDETPERLDRAKRIGLVAATLALVAAGYQSRISALYGSFGKALDVVVHGGPLQPGRFPVAQADFLERTGFEGKIFCQASWGGYLLYRLWPKVHVLVDGRGNHDASVTRDLRTIGNPKNMADGANGPLMLSIYDRYATDVIVHQNPAWPAGYTPPEEHWVLVEADEVGSIWLRPGADEGRYLQRLVDLARRGVVTAPP